MPLKCFQIVGLGLVATFLALILKRT
ncbi:hypothetical protein F3K44_22445 [Bacillus megaterium]|nr:hypothetical protein [Priestia megaterium]NGY92594.1 hypothetical protein [Priestia megaterium]